MLYSHSIILYSYSRTARASACPRARGTLCLQLLLGARSGSDGAEEMCALVLLRARAYLGIHTRTCPRRPIRPASFYCKGAGYAWALPGPQKQACPRGHANAPPAFTSSALIAQRLRRIICNDVRAGLYRVASYHVASTRIMSHHVASHGDAER